MKVVVATDSFKECLSAADASKAVGAGVLDACRDASVDLCPMADGGEGTVAAMVAATGGRMLTADTFDPLGAPIRAHFGLLGSRAGAGLPGELGFTGAVQAFEGEGEAPAPGGKATAVIEMAAASGLALVPEELRDPLRATTFGTGKVILAALNAGARQVIIGLGGSATVDGGCGCAQALGVKFIEADGKVCAGGLSGGLLEKIMDFDLSGRDARIAESKIRVACDVSNPLVGAEGAAAVYAPQKGATAEVAEQLERGLAHLAELIRSKTGLDVANMPGAGAAGGLGAGLVAFAGATLESGFEIIAEALGLRRRLTGADLCITGEGKLDGQSTTGKTACGVAALARELGVPVVCIPGQAAADAPSGMFASVRPLAAEEITVRVAMQQPRSILRRRAAEAVRDFLPAG
ncbi:MAG: glycerate kinase [Planctomycetota bacterium]|jgi:glycerate kinase